jgi:hypothetical protein
LVAALGSIDGGIMVRFGRNIETALNKAMSVTMAESWEEHVQLMGFARVSCCSQAGEIERVRTGNTDQLFSQSIISCIRLGSLRLTNTRGLARKRSSPSGPGLMA